jgi:hypothetical protein
MDSKPIMIFGLGDLGGHVLEILARVPNLPKIVTADIREDWGVRKTHSALIGAAQIGLYPDIEFRPADVFDTAATVEMLQDTQPGIIYNGMSLMSWWVITQLPQAAYRSIDAARYAPWFPMHFVPAYKLMQAVKKSGISTHVVNSAFPDLVNPVLASIDLAPTVGIGNVDNAASSLKLAAARMFDISLRSVTVYMVAPHFVSYHAGRFGNSGGAPYYLKIMVDDRDATRHTAPDQFLGALTRTAQRPGGIQAHPVVAASSCRIIMGMAFDTHELGHAPGPKGLPGGYPVKLSRTGAEPFLPEGIDLEAAIDINNRAQVYDGVAAIEKDGSVVLTEESAAIFKRHLDFDCRCYRVAECEAKARELDEKYKRWAARLTT